ncbi:myc target protein 1 homolog [Acanthopagrus schlegelii]
MHLLILKPEREGSMTAKFPPHQTLLREKKKKKAKKPVSSVFVWLLRVCVESVGGIMAHNETHPMLEILKSFNLDDMILAFCLSVLVGLLLGALVYVLLTWASRRRATARITQRSKKRSGTSQTNNPASSQMGLYRSTFLSVYRQPSLEPVGPLGSKPGLETSTFRPVPKRSRAGLDMGEDTQVNMPEDTAASASLDSASLVPNKRHSFWLGGNGLKGFLPSQTPPPAYDSVIHAFEETCT